MNSTTYKDGNVLLGTATSSPITRAVRTPFLLQLPLSGTTQHHISATGPRARICFDSDGKCVLLTTPSSSEPVVSQTSVCITRIPTVLELYSTSSLARNPMKFGTVSHLLRVAPDSEGSQSQAHAAPTTNSTSAAIHAPRPGVVVSASPTAPTATTSSVTAPVSTVTSLEGNTQYTDTVSRITGVWPAQDDGLARATKRIRSKRFERSTQVDWKEVNRIETCIARNQEQCECVTLKYVSDDSGSAH